MVPMRDSGSLRLPMNRSGSLLTLPLSSGGGEGNRLALRAAQSAIRSFGQAACAIGGTMNKFGWTTIPGGIIPARMLGWREKAGTL